MFKFYVNLKIPFMYMDWYSILDVFERLKFSRAQKIN